MIYGARKGNPAGLLRILARAVPPQLDTFVVPGLDIARARGLALEVAGLRPVATPRHATALLIVGALPEALLAAAVVVYAQMPRPRVLVVLGTSDTGPLPPADVAAELDQKGLETAVKRARELLRAGAWSEEAEAFEAESLLPRRRRKSRQDQPARAAQPRQPPGHHAGAHARHTGDSGGEKAQTQAKGMGATGSGPSHEAKDLRGVAHNEMGHGEMGFMSMVRLTQHLPRSSDGLPMDRVQAPFGPFFAGLPSGLELTLWLDGDTVARLEVGAGAADRGLERCLPTRSDELHRRLAGLDPFAPAAYRLLAERSLESAGFRGPTGEPALDQVVSLERERAASHLNWLAGFGYLLGYGWLWRRAGAWHLKLQRERGGAPLAALAPQLLAFLARVERAPLLAFRLRGVGRLAPDALEGVSGPVARASGLERDARLGDPLYRSLPFELALRQEGDALARLALRLEEVRGSLRLIRAAEGLVGGADFSSAGPDGEARVETPRGTAKLRLRREGDRVTEMRLDTPSTAALGLLEKVALGLELADALVAVASLDLSPWEVQR